MATKAEPTGSDTVLMLAIELLAVGLFAVIAGISDELGKLVLLFMVGFWLIYLVTNSVVVAGLGKALTNVTTQAEGR